MRSTLGLGRIGGIPIQFHWTFILLFGWVAWLGYRGEGEWDRSVLVSASVWLVLVFLSVLVHELGHALAARWLGIGTQRIMLFPLGGGAFLERMPEDPHEEILVSVGGPATNILLAVIAAFLIWGTDSPDRQLLLVKILSPLSNYAAPNITLVDYVIVLFFFVNLLLASFNLLPAYPLDGGRMLRATLTWPLGRRRATAISAVLGVVAALAFVYLAYVLGDWIMGLSGLGVGVFATFELIVNRRERILSARYVSELMVKSYPFLYLNDPLGKARELATTTQLHNFLVFDHWHNLSGLLEGSVLDDQHHADATPLAELLVHSWQAATPQDNLYDLSLRANEHQLEVFPVFERNQLVGMIEMHRVYALVSRRWR